MKLAPGPFSLSVFAAATRFSAVGNPLLFAICNLPICHLPICHLPICHLPMWAQSNRQGGQAWSTLHFLEVLFRKKEDPRRIGTNPPGGRPFFHDLEIRPEKIFRVEAR